MLCHFLYNRPRKPGNEEALEERPERNHGRYQGEREERGDLRGFSLRVLKSTTYAYEHQEQIRKGLDEGKELQDKVRQVHSNSITLTRDIEDAVNDMHEAATETVNDFRDQAQEVKEMVVDLQEKSGIKGRDNGLY